MSKYNEQAVSAAFQPYLQKDEFLINAAYCGHQRQVLGCLFGPIVNAFLTKLYMVGLTNRRVIVIRLANRFGGNVNPAEVRDYPFDRLPAINATFGAFATELRMNDPATPFRATFASVGVPGNYQRGQMIARELLERWQNKGAIHTASEDLDQAKLAPPISVSQVGPQSPWAAPAHFGQQPITPQYRSQQTSGTVYGCSAAALIAFGAGLLLLSALVILAMILDTKKTTRDTIGGIVGGGTMILFAASLIGMGIYFLRLRRSIRNRVAVPGSSSAGPPQTTVGQLSQTQIPQDSRQEHVRGPEQPE